MFNGLGLGLLDGDVHLETDTTFPRRSRCRYDDYYYLCVKDKVSAELQRLEEIGVIAHDPRPMTRRWVIEP